MVVEIDALMCCCAFAYLVSLLALIWSIIWWFILLSEIAVASLLVTM